MTASFFAAGLGVYSRRNLLQGVVEDVALLLPPEPLVGAQAAVLVKAIQALPFGNHLVGDKESRATSIKIKG